MSPIGAPPTFNANHASVLDLLSSFDTKIKAVLESHGADCSKSLHCGLMQVRERLSRRTRNSIQRMNDAYKVSRHITRLLSRQLLEQAERELSSPVLGFAGVWEPLPYDPHHARESCSGNGVTHDLDGKKTTLCLQQLIPPAHLECYESKSDQFMFNPCAEEFVPHRIPERNPCAEVTDSSVTSGISEQSLAEEFVETQDQAPQEKIDMGSFIGFLIILNFMCAALLGGVFVIWVGTKLVVSPFLGSTFWSGSDRFLYLLGQFTWIYFGCVSPILTALRHGFDIPADTNEQFRVMKFLFPYLKWDR